MGLGRFAISYKVIYLTLGIAGSRDELLPKEAWLMLVGSWNEPPPGCHLAPAGIHHPASQISSSYLLFLPQLTYMYCSC